MNDVQGIMRGAGRDLQLSNWPGKDLFLPRHFYTQDFSESRGPSHQLANTV